jgi:hypothetical protein
VTLAYLYAPALLLVYYTVVWFFYGRDPRPGPVITRYTPPPGLTPAAVRYLLLNNTDGRSLAALLVDLAWRKRITIEPLDSKYRVRFVNSSTPQEPLPPEEQIAMELLLAWDTPTTAGPITLDMDYAPRNSGLIMGILGSLQKQYDGVFYTNNYGLIALGVLATCLLTGGMVFTMPPTGGEITFLALWFLLLFLISAIVLSTAINAMTGRSAIKNVIFVFVLLCALLGLLGWLAFHIAQRSSWDFVGALGLLAAINMIFVPLMKALTKKGRDLMDYLAGYRQYLIAVESDAMSRMNAPAKPPGLLNEHLPYAIALDVKVNWGDHFSSAFFFTAAASNDA